MTWTRTWVDQVSARINSSVGEFDGDLSEFVGVVGERRFRALLTGRAEWEMGELMFLCRYLEVMPGTFFAGIGPERL